MQVECRHGNHLGLRVPSLSTSLGGSDGSTTPPSRGRNLGAHSFSRCLGRICISSFSGTNRGIVHKHMSEADDAVAAVSGSNLQRIAAKLLGGSPVESSSGGPLSCSSGYDPDVALLPEHGRAFQ